MCCMFLPVSLVCLSVCLSFCRSVCLSVCLSGCLSGCLSVSLSVSLPKYLDRHWAVGPVLTYCGQIISLMSCIFACRWDKFIWRSGKLMNLTILGFFLFLDILIVCFFKIEVAFIFFIFIFLSWSISFTQ